MTIILPEAVSTKLFCHGMFEPELTRMIISYLKQDMTFVDIGAHFGYYSLLARKIVGKKGEVHAFEPTPSSFNLLHFNLKKYGNVFVNKKGVYSRNGLVTFNDFGLEATAFNSIYSPRIKDKIFRRLKVRKYKIPIITLDDYVQDAGIAPDFIKIDAETAEYEILKGMKQTLEEYKPIVTFEVGDAGIKGVPTSRELVSYMIDRGYQPFEISRGQCYKHELKEEYEYGNILFQPSN